MKEQQLDLIKKQGRGGARKGAGRPKVKRGSVVMRVPTEYQDAIKDMITLLDSMPGKQSGTEESTEARYVHTDTHEISGGSVAVKVTAIKY